MKKITTAQRLISFVVIVAMTVNPALAAQPSIAQLNNIDRIVIDDSADRSLQSGLKESSNGTPVVDIAAPSDAGVSHNQFTEFNVDQQGVILNNSLNPILTQLGGWTDGNRRLAGGEARIILNEVTGLSRSQLLGHVEIAGQSAEFVLANPNGISCNGCGFINTPRVTMVTGKPDMLGGSLQGFTVGGGDFTLEGSGLNASAIDRFDIITRAAKINAELYARQLSIYTGTNYFDYQTGQINALDGTQSEPEFQFALDASSLGAMYANSIQLIGTEKGLGVNSAGYIQSVGDLEISADGEVRLKSVLANNHINISSHSNSITTLEKIYGNNVSLLAAQNIVNEGLLASNQLLELTAKSVTQQGNLYAGLTAAGELSAEGVLRLTLEDTFTNNGYGFVGSTFDLQASRFDNSDGTFQFLTATRLSVPGELINQRGTLAFSGENAELSATTIDNQAGKIFLTGEGSLTVDAVENFNNSEGTLSSVHGLALTTAHLVNQGGIIVAETVALETLAVDNNKGTIDAQQLTLSAENLHNVEGQVIARGETDQALSIAVTQVVDNTSGTIYSGAGSFVLETQDIINRDGTISAAQGGELQLTASNTLDNTAGNILGGSVALTSNGLINDDGAVVANTLTLAANTITNNAGHLQGESISLVANSYESAGGVLLAHGDQGNALVLDVALQLENTDGAVIESHSGDLSIDINELNNQGGLIALSGAGDLHLNVASVNNASGVIQADTHLIVASNSLNNSSGSLFAENITLNSQDVNNTNGIILADNLLLNIPLLNNQDGKIAANDNFLLQVDQLNNRSGLLQSGGQNFVVRATQIDNDAGKIVHSGAGALEIFVSNFLNNQGAVIGNGSIAITAATLTNKQGTISAQQGFNVNATALNNTSGKIVSNGQIVVNASDITNQSGLLQGQQLALNSQSLNNASGALITTNNGQLTLSVADGIDNQQGVIVSGGDLSIATTTLNNDAGVVEGDVLDLTINSLSNRAGVVQGSEVALVIPELNNAGGTIAALSASGTGLQLSVSGLINNAEGLLLNKGTQFVLNAAEINNQQGQVLNVGAGVLSINAGALNNYAGYIQSNTDLIIMLSGTTPLDNTQGTLSATQDLLITSPNDVINSSGRLLAGNALTVDSARLNNAGGLVSAQSLILRATTIDNIDDGVIEGDSVTLRANQFNNDGLLLATGTESSSLMLDVQALNNSGRLETYGQDLLLNNIALHSEGGEIIHHGDGELRVTAEGTFDNRQGALVTQGRLIFEAGAVDNRGGQVIAGSQLDIAISAINNEGGLIQSGDGLSLTLDDFNNSNGGRVVVGGTSAAGINVTNTLNNQQGSIVYWGGDLLTLVAAIIDNSNHGVIGGSGAILLDADQALDNSGGNIIGTAGVTISTQQLDNRAGGLIEADTLSLTVDTLNNDNAHIQAQQFTLVGNAVNNTNNGSIYALGDSTSIIDTQTVNNAGEIVVNQRLEMTAPIINNVGGLIEGEQLLLTGDTVENSGLIRANDLSLQSDVLINHTAGQIDGAQLIFNTPTLDNLGLILAWGTDPESLRITADTLTNSGRLESHGQNLHLLISNAFTNSGEILHRGSGVLSIQTETLGNNGGAIVGTSVVVDTTSLNNVAGEIYGQSGLTVAAQTINNQQGLLQSNQGVVITAQTLDNSQQGVLISGGDANVTVDTLANQAGVITAGHLSLTAQTVDNRGGEVIVNQLTLTADDLDNTTGTLAATAADGNSLNIHVTNELNNNGGLIYANGTSAEINATTLNNTAGEIEFIGNGELHITAEQLVNNGGNIRSEHDVALNADTIDNNDGSVFANNNAHLIAPNVLNEGGSLVAGQHLLVSAAQITNGGSNSVPDWRGLMSANWIELTTTNLSNRAGGRIEANTLQVSGDTLNNAGLLLGLAAQGESLQLTVDELRNSGRIESHGETLTLRDMQLDNSDGNLVHLGSGELVVEVEALMNRGGVIDATAALTVTTTSLDNSGGGILARGTQPATIQSTTLNNSNGLLLGDQLSLTSTTIDNTLGEISGNQIAIDATQVTNAGGKIAANQVDITVAQLDNTRLVGADAYISAQQLSITAETLNNQSVIQGAMINLQGEILDNTDGVILSVATEGDNLALDFAQGITNQRGNIESRGDNLVIASSLDNRDGLVFMAGTGTLSLVDVDNTGGELLSNGQLRITTDAITGFVANQLGLIQATQDVVVVGATIDNGAGNIKAGNRLDITANNVNNSAGLLLSTGTSEDSLQLTIANELTNTGGMIETHADNFSLSTHNINNRNGSIRHVGLGVLSINSERDFINDGGTVSTNGDMSIAVEGELTNDGVLVAANNLQIDALSVVNLQNSLISASNIAVTSESTVNRGRIQAETVSLHGDHLDNRAGELLVSGSEANALQLAVNGVDNSNAGLIENHGGSLELTVAINNQGGRLLNLGAGVLRLTALDNMGGQVVSAGDLVIDQQTINNSNGGLLQAGGLLSLVAQDIDNRSGAIYTTTNALNALSITSESLDNMAGQLLSLGGVEVAVNQTLDNTHGRIITMADTAQINTGALVNNFGEIVHEGHGELLLTSGDTLTNNGGRISTQGTLSLSLNTLLNNSAVNSEGESETGLITAQNFSLTATELQNNGGQIQASNQLSLTLPAIDNRGGKILALGSTENALSLNTLAFDNSLGGLLQIHASDANLSGLAFNNTGGVVNHQGGGALMINGSGVLQNAGGVLQSTGAIQITQADINNSSGIIYGQTVALTADNTLNNSNGGRVAAQQLTLVADNVNNTANGMLAGLGNDANSFNFTVNTLDNSGGTLRSGADTWSLNLDAIINTGGSILHTGNNQLALVSSGLLTTSGTIASTADLVIDSHGLNNQGYLVADKNLSLTSAGDITNTATGVIKGTEALLIESTGKLINQGQIASGTALTIDLDGDFSNTGLVVTDAENASLTSAAFSNAGTFAHNGNGSLNLSAGTTLNNSGLLKTTGTLSATATTISNTDTLSAASLNLSGFSALNNGTGARIESGDVNVQGTTFNNQGVFVASNSGASTVLNVNTLNNSGTLATSSTDLSFMGNVTNSGVLTHAGSGVLRLGNAGSVNIQGGKISTAGTANISGNLTGNGDLFARLGITIGGVGTFNNNGSKLYTQGNLVINSAVNNTQNGSMIADGSLRINTAGTVNNSTGRLQGANLQLTSGALVNTNGGNIVSTGSGSGSISATSINNTGGNILTTNTAFAITARQSDIDNTSGKIYLQSNGVLSLTANGDLINNGTGQIVSYGALLTDIADDITNQGTIEASSFDITAQNFTNSGTLLGFGIADSDISVEELTNTGSIKSNNQNLEIAATTLFNNTGGEINHAGLGVLTIDAPSVLNASADSVITSEGTIRLLTQGHFTNSGEISSYALTEIHNINALTNHGVIGSREGDVDIQVVGTLTNNDTISGKRKVAIAAATIANSGELQSDNTVELTMDRLNVTGTINAGNHLSLNVTEAINVGVGEAISTAGSLTLTTQGDVTNAGTIAATETLALGGQNLVNNGKIEGGNLGTSSLMFLGNITNNNKISSDNNLLITAGNYLNNGTTAAAGNLALNVDGNITNNSNRVFFAGGNLALGAAGTITNNSGSVMFAMGDVDLVGKGGLTANTAVNNTNGRIESLGDIYINTGNLTNTRTDVSYVAGAPTTASVTTDLGQTWAGGVYSPYRPGEMVAGAKEEQLLRVTETTVYTPTATGPDAAILAGGNMTINANGGDITNQYGTIASGGNLTIQGRNLIQNSYLAQAHRVVNTTRIEEWRNTDGYYCPYLECTQYFDGGQQNFVDDLDFAIGTISAVGTIGGNLSGVLVTQIASINIDPLNQNTQSSGLAGSADRGSAGSASNAANINASGSNGQTQSTTGQSLAHNGEENGNDANASGLTALEIQLAKLHDSLAADGSITRANVMGVGKTGIEQRDPSALTGTGSGSDAARIALAEARALIRSELSEVIAASSGFNATDAVKNAQDNGAEDRGTSSVGELSDPAAESGAASLDEYDLDGNLLNSSSTAQSTDVAAVDASLGSNAPNTSTVTDATGVAIDAPADSNTEVAVAAVTPPNPFAVDVSVSGFNPNNLGGLYVYNTAPDSKYLIEARPEFTDYAKFLGSDYLLQALGYDPEKTLKRLGDAFYENQLIRDALRSQTNTRFLVGATNDDAQMKLLMDNAVAANTALQLSVGIALSATQVAALTQDIVWLVEQVVSGQKVLVPTLYLASVNPQNLLPNGSLIAAGNTINLTADKGIAVDGTVSAGAHLQLITSGNFLQNGNVFSNGNAFLEAGGQFSQFGTINADQVNITAGAKLDNFGTINANQGIWLTAGDTLTNFSSGKVVSDGLLSMTATNDLINQQGYLEGANVFLTSKDGSIINRTEFTQTTQQVGSTLQTRTTVGDASTIVSHNNLVMNAGQNLDLQGSQFSAANDIIFTAGNDILLDAIENTQGSMVTGKTNITQSNTRWTGVSLSAGNNLILDAGNTIQAPGAQLLAGNNASLTAGGDINLSALANTSHLAIEAKRKKITDTSVEHTLANVAAGNNVTMTAGQDINLIGAQVQAESTVALHAERDMNLVAVNDSEYHYDYTKKKGSFGRSTTTVNETRTETAVGGVIQAGENVLINAQSTGTDLITLESGNVNIVGGQVIAGNHAIIAADGDINITASTLDELDYHNTSKKGFGGFSGNKDGSVEENTILNMAYIRAGAEGNGGSVNLLSGNNIALVGAQVVADGDINIEAVDQLLISAGEEITKAETWQESSGLFSDGNIYSKTESRAGDATTSAVASQLHAGGQVNVDAGSIKIIGSDIHGEQGITLTTDIGGIEVLAAKTQVDSYSYDKSLSVGMGGLAEAVAKPHELVENKDGRLTVNIAEATYDKVETTIKVTDMLGSTLTTGEGDIRLDSADSIMIEGSHLAAGLNGDDAPMGDVQLLAVTDVTIQEATNTYDEETSEVHGSAELSVVVQHQAVEVVKAVLAVDDAKDQVDQAKKDYKNYERDLDNLNATLAGLEADYANKVPGVNYEDILELRDIVKDMEGDKDWYVAGVVLAAANLTAKITALVQQTAAAAQSTGTYGFNAGIQLDIDASKTNTTLSETTAVASTISGNNIQIQTGSGNASASGTTTTIQGSHLNASGDIGIDTGELNILASRNTSEYSSETEQGHITAQMTVYGASGGASINADFSRSKSGDTSTTINNSTLSAENITIATTDDANIRGANVHANNALNADIGGDLNVESLQDRHRSKNNSVGFSAGVSFGGTGESKDSTQGVGDVGGASGVNGGLNASNGSSYTKETVLTSLTSGGTANITVQGNTQITGALIGTVDDEGNDLNQLTLNTGSLSFTDLTNINQSNQTSASISTSISLGGGAAAENTTGETKPDTTGTTRSDAPSLATDGQGRELSVNTSNIAYNNTSSYDASKSLATLGGGNITVGGVLLEENGERTEAGNADGSPLDRLNRDTASLNKDLWHVERTEGNVDVQIDHRMLSEEGRKQIAEDFKRTELLGLAVGDAATEESVGLKDLGQHITDLQRELDVQELLARQEGGKHAQTLNNLATASAEDKQAALNAYAQAYATTFGININDARVIAVNMVNQHGQTVAGFHYTQDGGSIIVINDNAQSNGLTYANTMGHEVTHSQISQGGARDRGEKLNEEYSHIRGDYAEGLYGFSFSKNDLGRVNTGDVNAHLGNNSSAIIYQNHFNILKDDPQNVDYFSLDAHREMTKEALAKKQLENDTYVFLNGVMVGSTTPDTMEGFSVGYHVNETIDSYILDEIIEEKFKAVAGAISEQVKDYQRAVIEQYFPEEAELLAGFEQWWADSDSAASAVEKIDKYLPQLGIRDVELVRSHYGPDQWKHSMGENTEEVINNMVLGIVKNADFYWQLSDSGQNYRAGVNLGEALHYVQDSYSGAHTARDSNGNILKTFAFNGQSLAGHAEHDEVPADHPSREAALAASVKVLGFMEEYRGNSAGLENALRTTIFATNLDPSIPNPVPVRTTLQEQLSHADDYLHQREIRVPEPLQPSNVIETIKQELPNAAQQLRNPIILPLPGDRR